MSEQIPPPYYPAPHTQQQYAPPPPMQPPPPSGTNGFAIASFIFGLLGGVLFGVIFGIVALVRIKKRPQRGKGLAIAGLSLSALWLLGIASLVVVSIIRGDDGSTSVTSLKAGDCLTGIKESSSIETLPRVPCTSPHEGEVFAVFDLPAGGYPGDDAVQKQSEAQCHDKFAAYAPKADADKLQLFYLRPLKSNWSLDRGVTCIVTDPKGTSTGSVKD